MSNQPNPSEATTAPNALTRMGTGLTETSCPATHTVEQTPKAAKRRWTAPSEREERELDDKNRPSNNIGMTGQGANDTQPNPTDTNIALANPHAQSSQRGPPLPELTWSCIAYTRATYLRVVKSLVALLAEILKTTASIIRTQPDKYLALLIYGGGNKIKEENPFLMADIQGFLQGLAIEGSKQLRVVNPSKCDNKKRGEFAKSHILLLRNGSPKLQAYLT